MVDIVEDNDNAYVAGLRQLLESVEPIIRQANSLATVEEILLNLETTDENFHKYELVKVLRQQIEDELGPLVETLVGERASDEEGIEFADAIGEEILASDAFKRVSQSVITSIKTAANEIVRSMADNVGHSPFNFSSSSDKYQRFPNHGPNSCGDESILASSFDGDDFMFMSPQKYSVLAKQLLPESSLPKRLEALNTLSQIPQTDLINSEFWSTIKKGLSHALKDDNHALAEKSLKFHAKMFATASGHVSKEIYTSLTNHMIDYFKEATSHMVPVESGLDLGDRRNIKLLKEFRLLNQFQHELPLFWVRYPEKLVEEILQSTVNLMSILPQPVSSNFSQALLSPYHFMCLIDPSAFWFCKWMHGNYSRAELIKQLNKSKVILKEACKSCLDFAIHCKAQPTTDIDDDAETIVCTGEDEPLIYSREEILCAHFIQSLSFIGRLLLYKEGRELFPVELEDRLETVTVPDLVVLFVEVISFVPPSAEFTARFNLLEPAYLASNILKNITCGSVDTCTDCICKDTVTNAFLQPVQKYLDGYLDLSDSQQKIDSTLILIADVLAVIATTQLGRSQLLYGEKQDRWQRSRLAPMHTIAQFTKKALEGKIDPQPSARVISAFLFVCRQLYNTNEGLIILSGFSLSECISKVLLDLKTKTSEKVSSSSPAQQRTFTSPNSRAFPSTASIPGRDTEVNEFEASLLEPFHLAPKTQSASSDYVTEEDLVSLSQSLAISATIQDDVVIGGWKYSESLIDNLLNYTSTPKGVLLVQQTGAIDECAQYMNSRYQQNLQVSKIEKFGYGVMMTQIASTAPGILALENAGYFTVLLENTWQCLEGVSNDCTKTVLSSNWDDFEDKQCKKFFMTLVNLLSSFTSVFELLSIAPTDITTETSATQSSNPDDPVTRINAFPVPTSFEELFKNLVFVDTSERMRLLFHFERSHFFGLRVLSSMVTCLDTFLLLQAKYHFQETLLKFQEDLKLEDGNYIIDHCAVERNQILVRSFLIGGATERIVPPRYLSQDPSNPYPWPMFSNFPVPSEYVPHDSNTVMTAFEQQDDIGRFLSETDSNSFDTLEDARNWLSKCRDVFVSSVRQNPAMTGVKSIPHLMERVCDALSQDGEEAIFPLVEYSGNESLLNSIEISEIEQIGMEIVIRYGISLRLIPPTSDAGAQFKHLSKQCKYFLSCQQRQFSSTLQSLQNGYVGFDWFMSSIYLIMSGKIDRSWEFLSRFSSLVASGYLWTARLHASIHLPKELHESGIHPLYSSVCHNLELVLQAEIPQIYSAFRMSGYPPSQICQHWLRQCFWNYLDWGDICCYLCCCLLMGIDYQIYFCMAVLKHLQRDIFLHTQQKNLSVFLREQPIRNFKLGKYIDFMLDLQRKYRSVVLSDLQDITKP